MTKEFLKEEVRRLEKENEELKIQYKILQEKYEKLLQGRRYNERGAGRKPSKDRLEAIEKMRSLYLVGMTDEEIKCELKISSSTFFRYKKEIMTQKSGEDNG